jgi:hypothetical protein
MTTSKELAELAAKTLKAANAPEGVGVIVLAYNMHNKASEIGGVSNAQGSEVHRVLCCVVDTGMFDEDVIDMPQDPPQLTGETA